MRKEFNDTGICIKDEHFMVDTTLKIENIFELIERKKYFIMNRPRQFGKTTALYRLHEELLTKDDYLTILLSFEVSSDNVFKDIETFCAYFITIFNRKLKQYYPNQEIFLDQNLQTTEIEFNKLSAQITDFTQKIQKKVVILIDEVDKSTNNQLFLHFLGMLRDKYLERNTFPFSTFHSVILVGIHDIKTIKLKIRPDEEKKINSPWNIAVDFKVNMFFNPTEISTMLLQYSEEKNIKMDIEKLSERIFYYTSGYPFLVSKMCKVVDEILLPEKENQTEWNLEDIENSFKYLVKINYTTTIFDDLFKNIENNRDLYALVKDVVINGLKLPNNANDYLIELANTYGIFDRDAEYCKINNRIFEQRMYLFFTTQAIRKHEYRPNFLLSDSYTSIDNVLDMPKILRKFQQFMLENYNQKDAEFIEREGRLLFLSFLRPIINGVGFDFKEPTVGDERRMDIVITYVKVLYILELKIWRGEIYHQKGLNQLSDYLDIHNKKEGYLLIFDFNKKKEFKEENIEFKDKNILAVWV